MKFATTFLIFAFSSLAMACPPQAQILAEVVSSQQTSPNTCRVFTTGQKVKSFATSDACSLSLAEIVTEGVEVKMSPAGTCTQQINGFVKRTDAGILILE